VAFLVDIVLALAAIAGGIALWIIFGAAIADHVMWLASFEFFIFPIIFIITVVIVYYQRWTCRRRRGPYAQELAPDPAPEP
jgi:membrane protein implicated in regulation of membrane protease activity